MDLHSEAVKRLQPCAELRALASAVGGRLFRLNGYKGVIVFFKEGVDFFG